MEPVDNPSADLGTLLSEFKRVAERFCADVDRHTEMSERDFVETMSTRLGRLYSLGAEIGCLLPDAPRTDSKANQTDPELFMRLEPYLQHTDRYRAAQFAYPEDDEGDVTREGCLAGDLTDVYACLKPLFQADGSEQLPSIASHFARSITGARTVGALQAIHEALHDSYVFEDGR